VRVWATVPERDPATALERSLVSIPERGSMSMLASAVAITAGGER
jgi:hypothetical protein